MTLPNRLKVNLAYAKFTFRRFGSVITFDVFSWSFEWWASLLCLPRYRFAYQRCACVSFLYWYNIWLFDYLRQTDMHIKIILLLKRFCESSELKTRAGLVWYFVHFMTWAENLLTCPRDWWLRSLGVNLHLLLSHLSPLPEAPLPFFWNRHTLRL